MSWLPKNPNFWLGAFIFWLISLFTLSSFKLPGPETPSIPHIDKVIHFGFFYGGSGLLIYLEQLREPSRLKAFIAGLNSIHLSGSEQGVLLFPTRFGTIT